MNRPAPALRLAVIAAVARNGAIGKDNGLLWHEPEDLKHFRRVTMGCPVIMGRKTWDSLPARFRPLPGRRNLVITRSTAWHADGAEPVRSLPAALALLADELVLTEIDADLDGDVFFPHWDRALFACTSREPHAGYSFATYQRTEGT